MRVWSPDTNGFLERPDARAKANRLLRCEVVAIAFASWIIHKGLPHDTGLLLISWVAGVHSRAISTHAFFIGVRPARASRRRDRLHRRIRNREIGSGLMPRFARTRKFVVDALSGPRVVFHHVPKCGGTSVAQALRLRYAVSFAGFPTPPIFNAVGALNPGIDEQGRARLVDEFQERLFLFYLFHDMRCVSGHVRYSAVAHERFSADYKFITTLRDPVSMMISHYFFQKQRPDTLFTNIMDIDRYLDTWEAKELGSLYSYFFSGLPTSDDANSAESIELAKTNLAKFDAIGFVDNIPDFQRQLREVVGLRLRIGHANKSVASKSERSSVVTPGIRRRMEEMSAPNIEIYEFARRELTG